MLRRRVGLALIAALLAGAGPVAARAGELAGAAEAPPGLLRSLEFPSRALGALPQWQRILQAMQQDRAMLRRCRANAADCPSPAWKSWRAIIAEAAKLPQDRQLRAINAAFNRWPYKLDSDNYGRTDYWAAPQEFLVRSGDCEDFAIVKFFALRELGFANDDLRIVALFDRIRGIGHAVLAVRVAGDVLILDSLSDPIFSHVRYTHYEPQYSVNETTRWAHIGVDALKRPPRRPESAP